MNKYELFILILIAQIPSWAIVLGLELRLLRYTRLTGNVYLLIAELLKSINEKGREDGHNKED